MIPNRVYSLIIAVTLFYEIADLQLIIVSLNVNRIMSSRKYASGNDKRKKKKMNR